MEAAGRKKGDAGGEVCAPMGRLASGSGTVDGCWNSLLSSL